MQALPLTSGRRAFTLLELLVVVAVLAILATLLLPALASASEKTRKTACLSNLRQVGIAVFAYGGDHHGNIPYGPKAGAFMSPMDFYPSTGAPTSLISLGSGAPVGLGLLLRHQLSDQPKVLFCPGSDQPANADAQLANVGLRQAQSSFYYRHAGNTRIFDPPGLDLPPPHLKLDDLGLNRTGLPIRALALDTQFLCPAGMATFGIAPRTHHRQRFADILFSDGHTVSQPNADGRFSVNLANNANLYSSFDMILQVLEQGDAVR